MDAISGNARRELVRAVGKRYRTGSRDEKRRILDEFVAVTRWHRKHAIRVLNMASDDGEVRRTPRARVYDVERMLAAATDDRYRVAVLLATEAGLRMGEIRGLQWGDIRDGQLTVRRALDKETGEAVAPKHNKARTIPLSPRLAAELAALPPRGLWVVGRLNGDALGYYALLEAIGTLYDRANVERPPKPVHCLRHTFGTVMAGRGVPLPVLQELMGHAEIGTTRRYIHVGEDQKRAAIAAVWQPRGSKASF
jgi:integrase